MKLRRRFMIAVATIAIAVTGATLLSCGVNDYCLNCGRGVGDGGHDGAGGNDGGGDANDGGSGCVPSGPEICDGIDNDCNGLIDDGVLPGVGDLCANQMGQCAGGVEQCTPATAGDPTTDRLICSKLPSPEICDNKDNDCNGLVDEGDPGGGGKCGTDTGACLAGTNHCVGGAIQCVGFQDHTHDPELCNLIDDNCNGQIDEGLTNMGACGIKTCVGGTNNGFICQSNANCTGGGTCASGVGACAQGTLECLGGVSQCCGMMGSGVCPPVPAPSVELCDHIDNDCDGQVDEDFDLTSDINNCRVCGNVCPVASKTCIDSSNPGATCTVNGDCPGGTCVENSVPTCSLVLGVATCGFTCKAGFHDNDGVATNGCEYGVCFASGIEVCDGVDNDCNGVIDDSLGAPPAICPTKGACLTGATPQCDGASGWRCHYDPAQVSTDATPPYIHLFPETKCNMIDDDCNGIVDDDWPTENHACDDGHPGQCKGTGTFQCNMANPTGPVVCIISTPGQSPQPESCDNVDNDCDGVIDNPTAPGVFKGWCSVTKTTRCTQNTDCPGVETCVCPAGENCNGGLDWINIGGGHQMMKYEAAKPDASASTGGIVTTSQCGTATTIAAASGITEVGTTATVTTTTAHGVVAGKVVVIANASVAGYNGSYVVTAAPTPTTFTITATAALGTSINGTVTPSCPTCSQTGVLPWTNVTYPQAVAACAAVGATLCTEQQWHRACSVLNPESYPIAYTSGTRVIEAENYSGIASAIDTTVTPNVSHAWAEDYSPGYSGMSAMQAEPDTGTALSNANAITMGPRLDYQINFGAAGTFNIDIDMFAVSSTVGTNGGNQVMVTVDAQAAQHVQLNTTGAWTWVTGSSFAVTAGVHTIHVYMQLDGVRIDAIAISDSGTAPALPTGVRGNTWAFASMPNNYAVNTTTCNGQDLNPGASATLPTGLASCYANDTSLSGGAVNDHAFDMSGNVKEWVLAHQVGENPIRGGAADSTGVGISCPLNFTVGNNTFFFPNVGFRCCR